MTEERRRLVIRVIKAKARVAKLMEAAAQDADASELDLESPYPQPAVTYDVADRTELPGVAA